MEDPLNPFARPSIPEVSVEDLERQMADGSVTVVDVREVNEYRQYHVPGVINIPLGHLPLRAAEIPVDKPVLVICEHGNRSLVGAEFLARRGFDGAASVKGGSVAWLQSRRPIEQG
jgi:hydroxyacylglutathione hydrolase